MSVKESVEVIATEEAARWKEVLEQTDRYQVYHLPEFHRLAEIQGQGQAVMPVYKNSSHIIAFPMLLRDITLPSTNLKDATSVGGFAGPVASPGIPDDIIKRFQQSLQDFFEQNQIVSVYNRLNPLLNQRPLLQGYGELVEVGVTLSIDLTVPSDEQFHRYRKTLRQDIRKLKESGYTCEEAGPESLDDFIRIYYDTMDRVGADKSYYFDKSYFEYLMREMDGVFHLWVCKKDGIVVSVELSALSGGVIEGYLSGTPSQYMHAAPSKLLCDAIRQWGSDIGATAYHLGGGVGAKRDALYNFKKGYGSIEHPYCTWRHVVDEAVYDELCREAYRRAGCVPETPYFPMYRHPDLHMK